MAENNELQQEVLDLEGLRHLWSELKPKIAEAKKAGTDAQAQVGTHNTDTAAHNDLRLLVEGLNNRLNALANSEDVDLDQMAELVAYIKDNRELIEQVTTGKVSVTDIVNDLVTNVANKPLSAAQGVALKKLIDDLEASIPSGITVDSALSDSSTNPVQNKVINTALAGKAPTQFVMTLTVGDNNSYTIDKTFAELEAAIQAGSQIRLVDTSGMEYVLVAFAAGYMAYFAHRLNSARHLIGFRYNNTIIYTSETPYTTNNKPKPADIGAAAESHGNHVPATETANNARFLRNDNTWQTVTPANIGAAASSHNQAASTITAGTLAGQVVANATAVSTIGTAQVRNIKAGTSDLTAGSSSLATGELYFVYE